MTDKRKRGAPRRGPYSGKKMSFSTKLTAQTMDRLTQSAQASEMSVSQKAEAAIIRGLDAEDAFQQDFAPSIRVFEQRMMLAMPSGQDIDPSEWTERAMNIVNQHSSELTEAIKRIASGLKRQKPGVTSETTAPPSGPAKARRKPRRLDLSE